jgi:hypothetical protein
MPNEDTNGTFYTASTPSIRYQDENGNFKDGSSFGLRRAVGIIDHFLDMGVAKETCRNSRMLQFLFGLNSMGERYLRPSARRRVPSPTGDKCEFGGCRPGATSSWAYRILRNAEAICFGRKGLYVRPILTPSSPLQLLSRYQLW